MDITISDLDEANNKALMALRKTLELLEQLLASGLSPSQESAIRAQIARILADISRLRITRAHLQSSEARVLPMDRNNVYALHGLIDQIDVTYNRLEGNIYNLTSIGTILDAINSLIINCEELNALIENN